MRSRILRASDVESCDVSEYLHLLSNTCRCQFVIYEVTENDEIKLSHTIGIFRSRKFRLLRLNVNNDTDIPTHSDSYFILTHLSGNIWNKCTKADKVINKHLMKQRKKSEKLLSNTDLKKSLEKLDEHFLPKIQNFYENDASKNTWSIARLRSWTTSRLSVSVDDEMENDADDNTRVTSSNQHTPKVVSKSILHSDSNPKCNDFYCTVFGIGNRDDFFRTQVIKCIMRAHGFDSRNSTPNSHRISRAVKDNSNRSKRSRAWKFYCSSKEFEAFCDSRKGGSGHFRNIELRWFLSNSKNRFDTDKIKKCVDLNIYDDSVDSNIGIATFNLGETGFPDSGERDISKMMLQHGIHILACQETHEPPDSKGRVIPECLWLNKPFPRLSAKKDCMHGLSFCIREDIGHLCCRLKSDLLDSNEETQWIRVRKRFGEYITLCNVYMPLHRKSVSEKRELFNKLSNEYNEIRNRFPMDEIYIMGDFNSKCGMLIGDWGSGIPDTKNSELFLNLINVNNMTVHEPLDLNNKHTRYPRCRQSGSPSIIDYIVSNKGQTNKYECINTMDDFGIDSDHRLLKFSIDGSLSFKAINKKMKSQLKLSVLKFKPDVQTRFHKTFDKLQFSRRIKSIIRGSKNSSKTRLERITHCSKALSGELRKLCAKICGTTSINTYTKHWIDDKCRSLMNKLKRLRKTNASDDRIKYTQKRLHKHIRKCKKDHINDLIKDEISKIRENVDPTRL